MNGSSNKVPLVLTEWVLCVCVW